MPQFRPSALLVARVAGAVLRAGAMLALGRATAGVVAGTAPSGAALVALVLCVLGAIVLGLAQDIAGDAATSRIERVTRRELAERWLAHSPRTGAPAGGARSQGRPGRPETGDDAGRRVALATDGAGRVAEYRGRFTAEQSAAVLGPLMVLVLLGAAVSPLLALLLAALILLIPVAIGLFAKLGRSAGTASRDARAELASAYLDAIQGLATLRLLRASSRVAQRLATAGEANRRAVMKLLARNQIVLLVTDGAFFLAIVTGTAGLAAWRFQAGAIDLGGALGAVLASLVLIEPLETFGRFFYVGMAGRAVAKPIDAILARPVPDAGAQTRGGTPAAPAATPTAAPTAGSTDDAPAPASAPAPALHLRSVSFAYGDAAVLDRVDLDVPAGDSLTVRGPSGAGKSTLLDLVAGDLVPTRGQITTFTAEPPARVFQRTYLVTGSIADNLRLARPDATDDALRRALAAARLDLADFPAGLETEVGERGLAVSGGQAQRIGLARAILSDRSLILLDEPTSQVDLRAEAAIYESLAELARDRSIIMVTHRAAQPPWPSRHVTLRGGGLHQGEDSDA